MNEAIAKIEAIAAKRPRKGKAVSSRLINMVENCEPEIFLDGLGSVYVTLKIDEHHTTHPILDKRFKHWMAQTFFKATGKAPTGGAISDAIVVLSGHAKTVYPVYTRVANFDETVYLDLCNEKRTAVMISATGWNVVPIPKSVRFIQRKGMQELPDPTIDAGLEDMSLEDCLYEVINAPRGGDEILLISAWLVAALRGTKPYPMLLIGGEHGGAKSLASRLIRRCIDPSVADLSLGPKEPRDLMIAATNSHVLCFDNISWIEDWFSDVLCCLSTGAGFRTRALFENADEAIFEAARPIVMNSIVDVIRRPDLLDRSIVVELPAIPEDTRRTEKDVFRSFALWHPAILARLADAVSQALRAPVQLKLLPRMADFATLVESAAPALGWEPLRFLSLYNGARQAAQEILAEGDPVYEGLLSWCNASGDKWKNGSWEGSNEQLRMQVMGGWAEKPISLKKFVSVLRRLIPTLRLKGIDVDLPKKKEIQWIGAQRGKQRLTRVTLNAVVEKGVQGVLPVEPF